MQYSRKRGEENDMDTGIVLVTFNRCGDLINTLAAYDAQTAAPKFIIVVDNKSTDGTAEYLSEWKSTPHAYTPIVLSLQENIGGSGGFYEGMKKALELECDWVFVADDDAVPHSDMLEQLYNFMKAHPQETAEAAALCTAVHNRDHNSGIHRCRIKKSLLGYVEAYVPEEEYQKEFFYIDIYSFVGTMIRRSALEKAGLARKDFFIYNDDYEHAVRVAKTGKIICVPSSVMEHVDNLTNTREATWRDYYGTRNAVIMHLEHFGAFGGFTRALRRLLVAFSSFNGQKIKVIWTAVCDAYAGKTGKHVIYRPGWKAGK